jgi:hypothetical protein
VSDERGDAWKAFIASPYVCDGLRRDMQPYLVNRPAVASHERLAFPHPDSLKRAALLADRIYVPCWTPEYALEGIPVDVTFGDPALDHVTAEAAWMYAEVDWPWKLDDPHAKVRELLDIYLRKPLVQYRDRFPRTSIVPINYDVGSAVLPGGNDHAYQAVLGNIPVVLEEQLSWEQVLAFREDSEAKRKFRDLHLWIGGLNVESERQATDLIAQKIDDYRYAIKKHGLSTWVHGISSFVSLGSLVPAAGGFAASAANLSSAWGAALGGALAVAGASAWVAKRLMDKQDVARGEHREIAYLYDLQNIARDGTRPA